MKKRESGKEGTREKEKKNEGKVDHLRMRHCPRSISSVHGTNANADFAISLTHMYQYH
jgi:hypothetical protein